MSETASAKKRACDSCHRRKIHCDGALPSCNWCSHHGAVCTFDRPSKVAARRSRKKTARDVLNERLARVEDTIAQARQTLQQTGQQTASGSGSNALSRPSTRSGSPSTTITSDLYGPTTLYSPSPAYSHRPPQDLPPCCSAAGANLGQLSSYNGVPFCSDQGQEWIESRTGTKVNVDSLCTADLPWQPGYRVDPALLDVHCAQTRITMDLPQRLLVEKYMFYYYRSKFRLVFPLVDPVLLQHTLELAYNHRPDQPTLEHLSAKACIFAFMSLVSMLSEEWDIDVEINGDPFILRAEYLLPQILHQTTVTSFQTVFILCVRHLFSGRLQMSSMFHTLACRMLFMLNAHVQPDLTHNETNSEQLKFDAEYRTKIHMRNLFWVCYAVDKEISLRTGLPAVLDDASCDLTLPPGYPQILYTHLTADTLQDIYDLDATVLPGELRLALLKSKTCRILYSARAMRKADAQLLRDIRELDNELEEWRLSVPHPFRPTLSVSPDCTAGSYPSDGLTQHMSMHQIIVSIEYHYLMATIHRASSRCTAWVTQRSGETSAIHSSLTLSLEASRSTLRYLGIVSGRLFGGAFWMVIFYPVSAILTIFSHILSEPLDAMSKSDLELLGSTPKLIGGFRKQVSTQVEVEKIDMLIKFVDELTRLGNCAVEKAQREQGIAQDSNEEDESTSNGTR